MNCTNCGNNLPDNSIFCPNCGSPVQTSPASASVPQQRIYQAPVNEQQNMNQQPINNQAMYQQPVNNQAMYQQPANNQAMYQQPVNNQAMYQQTMNNQAMYQQPANNQAMYQQPANSQQAYTPYVAPQKKKSKAPWIALGVSLFLLIAIVTIIIVLLVSSGPDQSTPKDAVDSFLEAVSDKEQEDLLEVIYPPVISEYDSSLEAYYDVLEDTLSEFDTTHVTFEDITVVQSKPMPSNVISNANSNFEQHSGYAITSGVNIDGTVMATVNGKQVLCYIEASLVLTTKNDNYYLVNFSIDVE